MADQSHGNSESGANSQGFPSQSFSGNFTQNFQQQHFAGAQQQSHGFQTQNGASTTQNHTPPAQTIASQHQPSQLTNPHPGPTLQVQDTTTIHPHPSDTNSVPNSSTYSDEKREIAMPATRGHTAAVAANVAANSNNIAESIVPQIRPGGAPARAYLNEKVVPYLLDGMKGLAKDQPQDPLRVLGEYLLQKSKEAGENSGDQMNG